MDKIIRRLVNRVFLAVLLSYVLFVCWNTFAPTLHLPPLSQAEAFAIVLLLLILG
jgi:hypothetical protein